MAHQCFTAGAFHSVEFAAILLREWTQSFGDGMWHERIPYPFVFVQFATTAAEMASDPLVLTHASYALHVEIDSHPAQPDLLTRVSQERGIEASEEERLLFRVIQRRRTNRHLFTDRRMATPLLQELEEIGREQGIFFQVVSEELRPAVVNLIVLADRLLWEKPGYRQELATWIRQEDTFHEGVPANALRGENLASSLGRSVARSSGLAHVDPGARTCSSSCSPGFSSVSSHLDLCR